MEEDGCDEGASGVGLWSPGTLLLHVGRAKERGRGYISLRLLTFNSRVSLTPRPFTLLRRRGSDFFLGSLFKMI